MTAEGAGPPEYRLILLRHAKAEPMGSGADELRPLALTGRRQAARVGDALVTSGFVPDWVLCSTAVRTRQTWELAATRLPGARPQLEMDDELYLGDVSVVLDHIRAVDPAATTVLVVGHEPTMAASAAFLADTRTSEPGALAQVRVGVPTATYSILRARDPWSRWTKGSAELTLVGRPA